MEPSPLVTQVDLGGIWHIAIFAGLSLAVVKWAWEFGAAPKVARILWAYVLISALFILEWPALHFGLYTVAYQAQAGQVIAELILTPALAMLAFRWVGRALPYFALYTCACIWLGKDGLLYSPSFQAAFAALCIPFVSIWVGAIIGLTVVTHHAGTAQAMILAMLLVAFIKKRGFSFWPSYLLFPAFAFAMHFYRMGPLLNGQGRVEEYAKMFHFWLKEPRWIALGVGPGSFMWTSVVMDHFKTPVFFQLHSDWLQILWESGAVGFVLAGLVFIEAVKRSWSNLNTLAGVVGCGVFALTYYPLRFFPTAILTAWIFVRAFNCKAGLRPAHLSSSSEQD